MTAKSPTITYDGPRLADGHRATDVGNGDRLVVVANGRLRYVRLWQKFIIYRDGTWVVDVGDVLAKELAKRAVHTMFQFAVLNEQLSRDERDALINWARQSESIARLSAMLSVIKGMDGVLVEHTDLDQHHELLNVLNGVIDLRTGALLQHDPEYLITRQLEVRYDSRGDDIINPDPNDPRVLWKPRDATTIWVEADSPRWAGCLQEWQPDQGMRDYLQLSMGAGATGYLTQRFDIHWGNGGNGKGVFFTEIEHVLGDYYAVPHKNLIVAMRFEQHETVKADLFGTRIAVAAETHRDQHLDEESIKELTGGEPLSARRMREDRWKFHPTHSLHLHTNHKPVIRGQDEGIWRRVNLVPWTQSFVGREDQELAAKLRAEAPGVLRWIVQGAVRWLANDRKFVVPEGVRGASERYRNEANPTHAFLKQWWIKRGTDLWCASETLHDAYVVWRSTAEHDVLPPWLSTDQLVKELTDRGFKSRRRNVGNVKLRGLEGVGVDPAWVTYVGQLRACCPQVFQPSLGDLTNVASAP